MNKMTRLRIALLLTFAVGSLAQLQAAQFQNPIQAAKDAYNKSKQQQQQQQGQPQQRPNSPSAAPSASPTAAPAGAQGTAASGDCCSAEAMKKAAAALSFVDIVGIKLGLTPEQAIAAIKAYNPNMKIETLTARMEDPSGPLGNFVQVPYIINAYIPSANSLGPREWIALQFTTPPNPPLVAKIRRYNGFAASQPVMASSLLESLHKKYGPDNFNGSAQYRAWAFDVSGKLLTRVLTREEQLCIGDGEAGGPSGGTSEHQGHESGLTINLNGTSEGQDPERNAGCMSLVFVAANDVGSGFPPNTQLVEMDVTLESGALMYSSMKSTHDWLQSKLDAKTKTDSNAAKQRSGPAL